MIKHFTLVIPYMDRREKLDASGEKQRRVVINYRKVNKETTDDRYTIEILDRFGGCRYFIILDLASESYQIEMHSDSIEKHVRYLTPIISIMSFCEYLSD